MEPKILTFRIASYRIQKWIHQNRGVIIDIVEGCLLNDYLVQTKRGYAAVYEHFLSEWASDYLVEFQVGNANELIDSWDERKRTIESHVLQKEEFS